MPTIKRYSNRKLYDPETRQYVTLDEIGEMIRRGEDVRIIDHVTGADLTTLTMAQIVFEQEKRIGGLLPQALLTQVVQAGGNRFLGLREGLRAFIDPNQYIESEIGRRVQKLAEDGKLASSEVQTWLDLLLAPEMKVPVEEPEPILIEDAASLDEYERLLHQVEELERRIAEAQSH